MLEGTSISESIAQTYTLLSPEIDFISRKMGVNRIAQALLLKYFQEHSRFPEKLEDTPSEATRRVSEQLADSSDLIHEFDWRGRTGMRFRVLVRDWLGFRSITVKDQADLRNWIKRIWLLQDRHQRCSSDTIVARPLPAASAARREPY